MTQQADIVRSRRRTLAAPGGAHDRLIRVLMKVLPAAIGVVAAVMIFAPLFQKGEISFLLDRNKVATTSERISVADAAYRGQDKDGRPFTVTAGNAAQPSSTVPVVRMGDLKASIELNDGPAQVTASQGDYNFKTEQIAVTGPVDITAADGYRMTTQDVAIDLKGKRVTGRGGVTGTVPTGNFSADSIEADLDTRTVTLEGRARLRMVPGKIRIPD